MSRRSTKARRAATRRHRDEHAFGHLNAVGSGTYYDPWGRPCSLGTWAVWFASRGRERFLANTHLPNGYWISTVWLGMDHNFGHGPPLIFESMVFRGGKNGDLDCDRYSTRKEALAGHKALVEKWRARPKLAVVSPA